jgi:hypothetical protein
VFCACAEPASAIAKTAPAINLVIMKSSRTRILVHSNTLARGPIRHVTHI